MDGRGRPRKPLSAQESKRRVHRSNAEKAERAESEGAITAPFVDVKPPPYLTTKKQKDEFQDIAGMLHAVDEQLFTELDVDVLARYIVAKGQYVECTKLLNSEIRKCKSADELERPLSIQVSERLQRMQNTAFSQCQSCASALGLTVSSRLKLDLKKQPEAPKENRFSRFAGDGPPGGGT